MPPRLLPQLPHDNAPSLNASSPVASAPLRQRTLTQCYLACCFSSLTTTYPHSIPPRQLPQLLHDNAPSFNATSPVASAPSRQRTLTQCHLACCLSSLTTTHPHSIPPRLLPQLPHDNAPSLNMPPCLLPQLPHDKYNFFDCSQYLVITYNSFSTIKMYIN